MYAPDSSVVSPDTPLAPTRGRTTQKRESLTAKSSPSLVSCTCTSTCDRSFDSVMVFTEPMSTSLYLTLVLPGSRPSALLKVIVIVGPLSVTDLITSARPISAAISGITQTSEGSQRLRGSISGSGSWGGSLGPFESLRGASGGGRRSLRASHVRGPEVFESLPFHVVPDEAWIELHGRHHGQNHHRAEGDRARSGRDHGKRLEAHQRDRQRDDEHVEHRPAADPFDHPVQRGALLAAASASGAAR